MYFTLLTGLLVPYFIDPEGIATPEHGRGCLRKGLQIIISRLTDC